jgi:maltooligosyltrehalose trehalohydrolase
VSRADVPQLGAVVNGGTTRFAATTDQSSCSIRLYGRGEEVVDERELVPRGDGIFTLAIEGVGHGTPYRFVIGGNALPDPYARAFLHGVHGPATVYQSKHAWRYDCVSRPLHEHVIYELHVGTFTAEGTYDSAAKRLRDLVDLGVTAIELMPIASFDGSRGWGYDGVAHYAPYAPYGTPDELRAFVDHAHGLGLSVLLDVVYNHFGPSGNYLRAYDRRLFAHEEASPWGEAPNFASPAMRRYVIDNALYWLGEFRFDGLRLDATHAIIDRSPKHVLEEMVEAVAELEPKRLLLAEDERNDPTLVTRFGLDALWADDFHHATRVTLTGEHDGYYAAYQPGPREIARTISRGWLYEGQPRPSDGKPRGASADALTAEQFVYCIQNHDQIGNRAFGDRLNHAVTLDAYLSVSMLLLFLPMTSLLFMGQEWASSSPFLYFTDHEAELGRMISEGRRREFEGFRAFSGHGEERSVPDPQAQGTFQQSKLDWHERDQAEHARVLELYRAALALRRSDRVLQDASRERLRCDSFGEVLVVERWHEEARRVLLVNFGSSSVAFDELPSLGGIPMERPLLSSAPQVVPGSIAPHTALILAARSDDGVLRVEIEAPAEASSRGRRIEVR